MALDFEIKLHNLTLKDIIYDPFLPKSLRPYLTLHKVGSERLESGGATIKFSLSEELYVEKRVRYNFWAFLGDVGGFNSALVLIATTLTVFYEEVAF